jgi:hypothetical protein
LILSDFSGFPCSSVVRKVSGSKRINRPWRLWGNSERCRRTHESETPRYAAACFMSQSGVAVSSKARERSWLRRGSGASTRPDTQTLHCVESGLPARDFSPKGSFETQFWLVSLWFDCDLKKFKHVASHCSTGQPVVLVDRDAGRPMLVRVGRLRGSPRNRGCQHRRSLLSTNTGFWWWVPPAFSWPSTGGVAGRGLKFFGAVCTAPRWGPSVPTLGSVIRTLERLALEPIACS